MRTTFHAVGGARIAGTRFGRQLLEQGRLFAFAPCASDCTAADLCKYNPGHGEAWLSAGPEPRGYPR